MGSSIRSPRYRWKEGRESDLRDYVDERVREGVSITQALKEYGQKNKMSWLTARWKYYQVKSQNANARAADALTTTRAADAFTTTRATDAFTTTRATDTVSPAPAAMPRTSQSAESRDDDFLGYLQDLVLATEEAGQDIVPFIKGFSRMAVLSRESMRLREDTAQLRERLKATEEEITRHCLHLGEWLGKSQVERVSRLKEFSDIMEQDLSALEELRERLAQS